MLQPCTVAAQTTEIGEITDVIFLWRNHFVDIRRFKYMPRRFGVHYGRMSMIILFLIDLLFQNGIFMP